jgi:hypothetical protein
MATAIASWGGLSPRRVGRDLHKVRVSQGVRHSLVTVGVVLAAPMAMAAPSIEGSPVRDAIRAPFEGLGVVTPEGVEGDGASESAADRVGSPVSEEASRQRSGDGSPAAQADVTADGTGDPTTLTPGAPEVADAATQPVASLPAAPPAGPAVEPDAPPAPEAAAEPDAPPLDEVTDVIDDTLDDPLGLVPDLGEAVP